jgi:hypothetical protein
MTGEDAAWLTRPDLPEAFERWTLAMPPGSRRPTAPDEWAGALVRLDEGELEVRCAEGGREVFRAGHLIALGWLPIVELHNPGVGPMRLVAVRRRDEMPSSAYLHVTRTDDEERR